MDTTKADLILFNANVLTMDPDVPHARMVAAKSGRIVGVGRNEDRGAFQGSQSRVIDCEGKTVIPGFNDPHMHLFALVSNLISLDCSPPNASSIVHIQRMIARKAVNTPHGKWIKAAGYNEFYLEEKRHPTRWDLDKAAPAHPVKLAHRTRHACVLNSRGLALARITSETPDPPGGLIERDAETGEPTGVLFGMNVYLSEAVVPSPSNAELDEGLAQADKLLLSAGITSVQDATSHNGPVQYERFRRAKESGILRPRVKMMVGFDGFRKLHGQGFESGQGDENFSLGAMKLMIDEVSGRLNPPQSDLNAMVLEAHREGFQVAIHAIEANTVEAAITAIEFAQAQSPRADHRHRIEHCSECPSHLLERLAKNGVMVVTQPAFLYFSGERYFSMVEPDRLPWLYRISSWQKAGIRVAASSDAPVTSFNPLVGMYAAVTRKAETGQEFFPEESVSSGQALWMHTLGGAYVAFEESVKGSIAIGKLADLVVLSADPTQVPTEAIKEIRVEKTILGGEIVWEA